MILGIVGPEQAKFTEETEANARLAIRDLICDCYDPSLVVSGGCHLGGVDKFAVEEAQRMGVPYREYLPKDLSWSAGYKPRNLEIARASDVVVCITVRTLPEHYTGMRFRLCYHCGTDSHVKSGGCWTMKQAAKMGKETKLVVL